MPIVKGSRRFQSNIVSFRQVVSEISSLVPGSNVQQSPFTSKRKRITSADRRALLESFVNKYRGMNSGKFPTPTSAQKEVGGGYYSIRKMLQEMEYNSKLYSLEKAPVKEIKKENKNEDTLNRERVAKSSPSQQQVVSNSEISMDQNLYEEAESVGGGNSDKNSKGKEGLQPSTSSGNITRDDTHGIATKSHEKLESHAKDESDKFGFEGRITIDSKPHEHEHDDDGIRNIAMETSESQKYEDLREKALSSSLWGNLKSLASGFINIWKKQ